MSHSHLVKDNKRHNTGEMSKMQVLHTAVERIKKLKESIVQVNGDVDRLRKEIAGGQRELSSAEPRDNHTGVIKNPSPTRVVTLTGQ